MYAEHYTEHGLFFSSMLAAAAASRGERVGRSGADNLGLLSRLPQGLSTVLRQTEREEVCMHIYVNNKAYFLSRMAFSISTLF